MKQNVQDATPQIGELRFWLSALSHVVSRLEKTHAALVEAVINMPWMVLDAALVKTYTIFIGMLLSARPEYLALVLARIAQGFTYRTFFDSILVSQPPLLFPL